MERTLARVNRLIMLDGQEAQYIQLQEAEAPPESDPRRFVMVIGRAAAAEIRKVLREESDPRPMTHQLCHEVVQKLRGRIRELVIHELDQGTYFAELRLEHGEDVFGVDCRPSDGIALSLRGSAPIYVTEKVWKQAAEQ